MIKKYNLSFVNLSAVAGDRLAVSILPVPCEQGPLCLLLSLAVIGETAESPLCLLFLGSPQAVGGSPLVPWAEPIWEIAVRKAGSEDGVPDP